MDPRLEQLGRGPIPEGVEVMPGSTDLAAAFNASLGTRGATAPQEEEQVNSQVDTAPRTAKLTNLKEQRDKELQELRQNNELTPAARETRLREAREKWGAKIREEAQSVLQRIDEEDGKLEREMYEDAVRFGDQDLRRLLERVAPPWLEDTEQRARFDALVSENEPQWKKEVRAKRARLADEKRHLLVGFSLQGVRV
jgi:hypothetical protein